jgi:hypothetical protein
MPLQRLARRPFASGGKFKRRRQDWRPWARGTPITIRVGPSTEQSVRSRIFAIRALSLIAGRFTGWWPKDEIPMTNGQVWQISDEATQGAEMNAQTARGSSASRSASPTTLSE